MLEPVGPESGTRPISVDFVKGAAELCKEYGALLIFDEVVTAFRLSPHGAQGIMGVEPDLTVFGKVIAGGYPGAGGVGGKEEFRKYLAAGIQTGDKVKKALVGGTMAATPLSALAGYYTLKRIYETNACEQANAMGDRLTAGLKELIKKHKLPFVAFNQGSICHLETVGTMHFSVNWAKPWTIPAFLSETSKRKAEMEHMGAAYMAKGLVTLAGSKKLHEAMNATLARSDAKLVLMGRHGAFILAKTPEECLSLAGDLECFCTDLYAELIGRKITQRSDILSDSDKEKDLAASLRKTTEECIAVSVDYEVLPWLSRSLKPYLDDFAQICGVSVSQKRDSSNVVFDPKAQVAICFGKDEADARNVRAVLEKNARAANIAQLSGLKPIAAWEAFAMRLVYQKKYSKQAKP